MKAIDVYFLKETNGTNSSNVLAVFPEQVNKSGMISCYCLSEGFSTCSQGYLKTLTAPTSRYEIDRVKEVLEKTYGLSLKEITKHGADSTTNN